VVPTEGELARVLGQVLATEEARHFMFYNFAKTHQTLRLRSLRICGNLVLFNNEQSNEKNDMPKSGSRKTGIGANGAKNAKIHFRKNRVNGYVHVISPATASEIRRAVGVKRSDTATVLRVFANVGVKV
jgi:hypothetical protein